MTQKLSDFLIELSNNPAQIEAFRANPDRVLDRSGLDERDKGLMESGDVQAIQEEIEREVGMRPTGSPHAISIVLPDPPTS